jgi:hypothetical protein
MQKSVVLLRTLATKNGCRGKTSASPNLAIAAQLPCKHSHEPLSGAIAHIVNRRQSTPSAHPEAFFPQRKNGWVKV